MDSANRIVRQWAVLSREMLVAKVAAMVRQPPPDPSQFWGLVSGDVVLAAAVRGILAGLLRDKQGSRDESFWAYRIATVRALLDSPEQAPARIDNAATCPVPVPSLPSQGPSPRPSAPPVSPARLVGQVPGIEFRAP
jgi:hypothetical protein